MSHYLAAKNTDSSKLFAISILRIFVLMASELPNRLV